MNSLDDLVTRLDHWLWETDRERLPAWRGDLLFLARMTYGITRDLTQGYLSLQAMSLVYTTLLSLVPLLAVSFSVLKGFGAHNQLEPLLLNALAPLGEQGQEISDGIIEFVDNMRVGVLGSVGLVILLYTVISLIQKIELVFNYTWRVAHTRPFAERVSQYLSVLLIGPVLVFSAFAVTAAIGDSVYVRGLMAIEPMGHLISLTSRLAPYLLISTAFAFVYIFVPNTRVHLHSAVIGALVAGALWQGVGWLFTKFMVGSTQYAAIYSSLAILILFMIWIYVAWLILLVGGSVAFYHQHPEFLNSPSREAPLSNLMKEHLALMAAASIARTHYSGDPPWCNETLSKSLHCPGTIMERVLGILERGGFLLRTGEDPPRFLPAQAPESVSVKTLFDAVRCCEETGRGCRERPSPPGIRAIEQRVDAAIGQSLEGLTLRDLAKALDAEPDPAQTDPAQVANSPA